MPEAINVEKWLTAEGAVAARIGPEQALRRTVAACLLWEDVAYEKGQTVAERIRELVKVCSTDFVASLAYEARTKMNLRKVPLLLLREMARTPQHQGMVARLMPYIIQRADELAAFLEIYWKDNPNQPLSAQVKKGLGAAFKKFGSYQLAKYKSGAGKIKLRDVMMLVHAKTSDITPDAPHTAAPAVAKDGGYKRGDVLRHQGSLAEKLIADTLEDPGTWETRLSAGEDKKAVFTELLQAKELGALAFIRNLRNMDQAGIDPQLIADYAAGVNVERVLPFRYVAAYRQAPKFGGLLESLLLRGAQLRTKLPGTTLVIVDTSGSMFHSKVSKRSDLSRLDAAGTLAAILQEGSQKCIVLATADITGEVEGRGFQLVDSFSLLPKVYYEHSVAASEDVAQPWSKKAVAVAKVLRKFGGGGIYLTKAMAWAKAHFPDVDRIVVLTDEQDCGHNTEGPEHADAYAPVNYLINVSTEKNGIGYGDKWVHIDGWSEAVVEFIHEHEKQMEREKQAVPA